jgi:tripartite-type tricarboxylate transporter receptor subunit TctC
MICRNGLACFQKSAYATFNSFSRHYSGRKKKLFASTPERPVVFGDAEIEDRPKMQRDRHIARAAFFSIATLCASVVSAQPYPSKPVRILVGQGPGGGADSAARTIAPKLADVTGAPFIVENRTGAGGSIAIERVAASAADGYTLLLMNAGGTIHSALRRDLPYNLQRDLAPISLIADSNFVLLVHPSVPVRNPKDLIALARTRPGGFTYASAGVGSSAHLATELLASMAHVKLTHVPYKGGVEAATANASGQVDMGFASVTAAMPLIRGSKVRALAVSGLKRSAMLPDVPTLSDSALPGYDRSSWFGLLAPAKVPQDIVKRLNAAITEVVALPQIRESLVKQALEPRTTTPEQFEKIIERELAQNLKLVKLTGARAE